MTYYDAMNETFSEVVVCGKPALFTRLRIDPDTVPRSLHCYEVRYDEFRKPSCIAPIIIYDCLGTIILSEPLKFFSSGRLGIDYRKDWEYIDGTCDTIKDFIAKHQPEIFKEEYKDDFKVVPEAKMNSYSAYVTDKETGQQTWITSEYPSMNQFVTDLRSNGYSVSKKVNTTEKVNCILEHSEGEPWRWGTGSEAKNKELFDKYLGNSE